MKHNIADTETFVTDNGDLLIFCEESFEGMVGEHCSHITATLIRNAVGIHTSATEPVTRESLTYEKLRADYKGTRHWGRTLRIRLWRWIRSMSPAAVAQRQDDEQADAISRVI